MPAKCPHCRYDQTGMVATWLESCPMEARCPECGKVFASSAMFELEDLGPVWSIEHASRRYVRKWLWTSMVALTPSKLWKDLKPEHPVLPRRLVWMAVSWLLALHLVCGLMISASRVWMILSGTGATPVWGVVPWDTGWFWRQVLLPLAWPYPRMIEIPMSANTSFGNPVDVFVILAVVPMVYMGLLTGLLVWWPRRQRLGGEHLARAFVLMLPSTTVWLVLCTAALFIGASASGGPGQVDIGGAIVFIATISGLLIYMMWWWRSFAVGYWGRRRGMWLLIVLAFVSLILAVATGMVVETVFGA